MHGVHVGRVRTGPGGGQAPVSLQAEVATRHVVVGQVGVDRELNADLRHVGRRGPGQLGHRLGNHLAVEVVADRGDVAALAGAQQVASPPDLQVPHGDPESRPQLGGLADGAQPLVGRLAESPVRRGE